MNLIALNPSDPKQNQLLSALSDSDLSGLLPYLEQIQLFPGDLLAEVGVTPAYIYFPTTAIVSLLHTTSEGASCEIAVIGNEGVVGVSLFMGGNVTSSEAVVQSAGQAFRLRAQMARDKLVKDGNTLIVMMRYAQTLLMQIGQTAACNRFHSIDQQLCRRLLLGLDRSISGELVMTHELAASLLGVRREGVSAAAYKLQQAGVISYRRGHITVLDRAQLEKRTCECYCVAAPIRKRLVAIAA
jgi:CRP-like cAMP-binding protein